jgi:hypothetical protein
MVDITQEDLIYEYLIQNVRTAKSNVGQVIQLSTLPRYEVLEMVRCLAIPNASFQTFAPITNAILLHRGSQLTLVYTEGISSQDDYFSKVEEILRLDKLVLISAKSYSGWHITVVYQSDGTNLSSYDPGRAQHVTLPRTQYQFSHDLLYLQ